MTKLHTKIHSCETLGKRISSNKDLLEIYKNLERLYFEYPNFKDWFWFKVIPGVSNGLRTIITKKGEDNNIICISILKHDGFQKKICTLWVKESYQYKGIGSRLLEESIEILKDENPLITVSETRKFQFYKLFNSYNFIKYKEYPSYYKDGYIEISYNAHIEDYQENASIPYFYNSDLKCRHDRTIA